MTPPKNNKQFFSFVDAGVKLGKAAEADAVLVILEQNTDWKRLKKKTSGSILVIATNDDTIHAAATELEIHSVLLEIPESSVQTQMTQAVLASVASEFIRPGSTIVSIYSGFDTEQIDTISVVKLTERLGRLTARDLRKLETKVPLDTLRTVVDLAVEIGREGREGKAVGAMFVVGDHKKVLTESRPGGFDLVKGYSRKERSLFDNKVREGIKEIAQMDGMFVVSADGTVEGSSRIIDTSPVEITMTQGLGSRHFAGAAISKNTKAISVVISQSSGTVRIFQNGEVVLRIEPLQRAMKWKNLEPEAPPTD
ncbi:MAG: DNA integrity scanning protein DisA nucleotide-binding domain protein [Mariniblastus sp.]